MLRGIIGSIFGVGLIGGLTSVTIEVIGANSAIYGQPSATRANEIVAHGHHIWVSQPIWLGHIIGQILFLGTLGSGAIFVLVARFTNLLPDPKK